MNVCMIMCHKDAKQVLRLARRCTSAQTDVVIHADSQMQQSEYETLSAGLSQGMYLTDQRLHGVLDTRSLVDIVFIMIQKAQQIQEKENKQYKYYMLLSGQDYPIESIDRIESRLAQAYPRPYIDCTPCHKTNWVYKKFQSSPSLRRLDQWFYRHFSAKRTLLRRAVSAFRLLAGKVVRALRLTDYHRLSHLGVSLYGGSAWWILPDQAVDFIVREFQQQPTYVKELLATRTPEETFFQTLVMRSPVGGFTELNPVDMREQNCKTYAYFQDQGKPFKGHPYILTATEYEMLLQTNCWFARKFDAAVDSEILDKLDAAACREEKAQ